MGRNSKIDYPIWPGFELVWEIIPVHFICMFQNWTSYADENINHRLFQLSKGSVSTINNSVRPYFELIRDSIQVQFICNFQEDPIKPEWFMLMTKTNRDFFSNQGDATLRIKIQSGQFLNFRDCIHIHLICKFQNDTIKTERVKLMAKSNRDFFNNQWDMTLF